MWEASNTKMPFLAYTSLNVIELLLKIVFLFLSISSHSASIEKVLYLFWFKKLNQIDPAMGKWTLNLEGLKERPRNGRNFSPKLLCLNDSKLLGVTMVIIIPKWRGLFVKQKDQQTCCLYL